MNLDDFHYDLPPELIAQTPSPERSDARLLVVGGADGTLADRRITDIVDLIEPGDLLVFNDTQVLAARLFGHKDTGGRVELLIERVLADGEALAHIKASKAPKTGTRIRLQDGVELVVTAREAGLYRVRLDGPGTFDDVMRDVGHIPLPPYITRAAPRSNSSRCMSGPERSSPCACNGLKTTRCTANVSRCRRASPRPSRARGQPAGA